MVWSELLLLLVAGSVSVQAQANDATLQLVGLPPCDALIASNLSHLLIQPNSPQYEPQVSSYYALNARRRPWCFVLPRTAADVSSIITALDSAGDGAGDWAIAVKSGGYGSDKQNNVDQGVTIDLSYLNGTSYDAATNVARIQPGGRWVDVYTQLLERDSVTVAGGRAGGVGVAGYLLGGGNSYYTPRTGFGCDNVVNYEVVLANGSIINANGTHNSNLWRALKGGGSNFGIVTRFDMNALPAQNITYSTQLATEAETEQVLEAIVGFTEQEAGNGENTIVPLIAYDPVMNMTSFTIIKVNTAGDPTTTAFDAFNALPQLMPPMTESISHAEAASRSEIPPGRRTIQYTLTLPALLPLLTYTTSLLRPLATSIATFVDPSAFTASLDIGPLPLSTITLSSARGLNVLGLERTQENQVQLILSLAITDTNTTDSAVVYPRANARAAQTIAEIRQEVQRVTGQREQGWVNANYADSSQDVLGSYGEESVSLIREVAERYDPEGFFQRRVPGGFKIGRVR